VRHFANLCSTMTRIFCVYTELPNALLLLILALVATPLSPAYAQDLQLNKISTFSISSTGKSLSISLPQTTQPVILSVELCTQIDGQPPPQFFASASNSQSTTTSASAGGNPQAALPGGGQEINIGGGLGFWTSASSLPNGGELDVQLAQTSSTGTWSFSVGVSTNSETFSLTLPRIVLIYICS